MRKIRSIDPHIPIIATGGKDERTVLGSIGAGANAITYTAPTSGELLRTVMNTYRAEKGQE